MSSSLKLRVRLVLLNIFKPSSDFFTDHFKAMLVLCILLLFMFHVCLCYTVLSVSNILVTITCWERPDLLTLLRVVFPGVVITFPYGMVSQVRCGT